MERFFDILFSLAALIFFLPMFIPIIIILKFTGEGEIFYLQERIGRNQVPFKIFKFVTMVKNSANMGTGTITMKNDPRILPVGSFLRKTKINELPQLLNILIGDISVIGPRPLTTETFNAYTIEDQRIISKVKPGLSGIGSIVFRGEEEIMQGASASRDFYINEIAPYKAELEKWFVQNKSLYLYFKAIFVTLWVVIFSNSSKPWNLFQGLPKPPKKLKKYFE